MKEKTHKREITTYVKRLDIPEEKIAEYKEAFDMFDKDKGGTISVNEIVKIMKNFGYPLTKAEAKQMISEIDDNGDGEIDFEEFVTLMEKQISYVEETDDELVLRAFKFFDKNHDGKFTNQEFKYLLTQMGDRFTKEELDELFEECNLNPDGELDFQDFINFWKKTKAE